MLNQSILLAKAQSNATGGFMSFGILIVFIVIMYFFMIRPQRKKDKETQEMRNAIKVGDDIITIGGIVGKVVKVREESLVIAVGADKVKFEVMKRSVSTVLGAGEKASEKKSAASREEKAEEEKNGKKNSIRILKKKEDEEAQTPEQPAEKEEK